MVDMSFLEFVKIIVFCVFPLIVVIAGTTIATSFVVLKKSNKVMAIGYTILFLGMVLLLYPYIKHYLPWMFTILNFK